MKGDFAKFGLAVGAAGVVIGVIATQMKKAVDVTVTYADEVRTLSSVTNQSAETTSRMIQTLDDYGLSAQQAGMAAKFLAKEGLSLNIETLAKLSDEYKKLNSGQERAEFLMKNFGKAGQDFTLIMEQGSQAILERNEAVKDGLILSAKELREAQELKYATDDLEDSKRALYVTLGTKLIPIWVDYLDSVNRVAEGENIAAIMFQNFASTIFRNIPHFDRLASELHGVAEGHRDIRESIEGLDGEIRTLGDAEEAFLTSTREMTPKAVAEFVTLQTKIGEVKRMIAAGASFNVIVNFLAGRTIMVDPNMGMSMTGQQWAASQAAAAQKAAWGAAASSKAAGSQKTVVSTGKPRGEAVGGPVSNGWTMVGEAGPELISPSGMVINAHNTRRMLNRGIVPGRRLAVGGDDWGVSSLPSKGFNLADDWVMMNMPGALPNWTTNYNNSHPSGGGGGASAVIQTAAVATQAASSAAQQTSRAVDVTAQMASQQAMSSAMQAASLASIDRRLANLPNQIRDAFQQVIQQ